MRKNGLNWSAWIGVFYLIFGYGCQEANVEYRGENEINILPTVQHLSVAEGHFTIDSQTKISALTEFFSEAIYLKELIEASANFNIEISNQFDGDDKILLVFDPSVKAEEGYQITIADQLLIKASSTKGMMHGIQTVRQLFIADFHAQKKESAWHLPKLEIEDAPRFKHRGLLLDCARHFFEVETIKQYIDLLALYKMNVLHWHLTEDQGWRIAIDAFPKLTEIGAWRTELDGSTYGGFYSKEEIREIVSYATERQVTIIPEIELPGHSQAAIAAYPQLSCTGAQVDVANDWGVFKEIYCAGNDSTFIFLEQVLTEVMALFPSKYIHIGGDEAPKYRWEHCAKCQARMKSEGLADAHELQSYFISRIETFLNKNGRALIGWDEILEGGLSPNATVQSWRGMDGGITAANAKHEAIMSPTSHAYFDYDLKAIDLERVYTFDPIPESLPDSSVKFIIGGECNMWTEHVPNKANLDAKVFPRLLAMSEVLWAYPEKRDYLTFYDKVQSHYPILSKLNVAYGHETVPASINLNIVDGDLWLSAKAGHPDWNLKYKWQRRGARPATFLTYQDSIKISTTGWFELQVYKDSVKYGDLLVDTIHYHRAIGKTVIYKKGYSEWYTAGGDFGLVDGRSGDAEDFRDGKWQGFWGDDIDIIIDLGETQEVSSIETHFFQYINSWIFMPQSVHFFVSSDGNDFREVGHVESLTAEKNREKTKEKFKSTFENQTIRYIRLTANNIGPVPAWHEAAGAASWLFIDEIIVR